MSVSPKRFVSGDEYLERERQSSIKSEYFQGEVFAMAGASETHNLIVSNLIQALGPQLRKKDCVVYPGDMRVRIDRLDKYTYPDVSIACGERVFLDKNRDTLLNPIVIIEVLSESTEAYDRGKKFEHYQYIDTFSEYVLVAQDHCRVEHYLRQQDGAWRYSAYNTKEDALRLAAVSCELRLEDIYHKVDFSNPSDGSKPSDG